MFSESESMAHLGHNKVLSPELGIRCPEPREASEASYDSAELSETTADTSPGTGYLYSCVHGLEQLGPKA